jgi:hypothetical protein
MSVYADTSPLILSYIGDSNSLSAQAVIQANSEPLPFTRLHRLEVRSALGLGVFRGILAIAQAGAAWSDVQRDLPSGRLVFQTIHWRSAYRAAAQWAALHSPRIGCRSLDVLHLSLARRLHAKEFFTFDARQKSLALALGFAVKP